MPDKPIGSDALVLQLLGDIAALQAVVAALVHHASPETQNAVLSTLGLAASGETMGTMALSPEAMLVHQAVQRRAGVMLDALERAMPGPPAR